EQTGGDVVRSEPQASSHRRATRCRCESGEKTGRRHSCDVEPLALQLTTHALRTVHDLPSRLPDQTERERDAAWMQITPRDGRECFGRVGEGNLVVDPVVA